VEAAVLLTTADTFWLQKLADSTHLCAKRPYKDLNESHNFKYVIVSLCNKAADGRHGELKKAIEESHELTQERLIALSCLLDELVANNCISFQEVFDQGIIQVVAKSEISAPYQKNKLVANNCLIFLTGIFFLD